ncbi:helix-turn-helix domain-containing protein [Oryzomonas rubra]|uniref:MerR family transcriptional regulator n=1 Tax=Oryzomonas rubra TaxID=2509454 RepID=A0A5A9XAF9_9BACT|nr:helix-turn-helix domain-containing protein [Oryzomonas rubra]KAA0889844.1 MerR family transcriptional regulator [Oryzomonas rubra]
MAPDIRHTLDELSALVDIPKRTIRFYVENGVVDRPRGVKKGAYYTQKHVEQLLSIKKWQQAGLSLERIKSILDDQVGESPLPPPLKRQPGDVDVWSHIYVQDGVELLIEPKRSGLSPDQVNRIFQALQTMLFSDTLTSEEQQ